MSSCPTCGHDHDYGRGENCGICGRCPPPASASASESASASSSSSAILRSPQPQQILSPYLFLGSFNDFLRLLLVENRNPSGITRYLSVDPAYYFNGSVLFPHLHFHALGYDINTKFDEAFEYIRQCERDGVTVLVYCMSGNHISAAVVIAYLMRRRSWPLQEAFGWLSHRRPRMNIVPGLMRLLEEYEQKTFPNGTTNGNVKHD